MTLNILILTITLTNFLISPALSQSCTSQTFKNNKVYKHCSDLSQLTASIHWTYDASNSTLDVAFVAPPAKPDGWISWAINPTGKGMAGSQALVGFKDTDGSMTVNTLNIKSYSELEPGKLSFDVSNMAADSVGEMMRIFVTVKLPATLGTTINQVWQVGSAVMEGFPAKHAFAPGNLGSMGTLDLLKGQSSGATPTGSTNKYIHGFLNVISWGFMFPVGILIARYLRTFPSADPAWFYLHVFCQVGAYIIGVAGWGTGLKLGSKSGNHHYVHRNIGISLFCLATVQLSALFLRPNKDHKFRVYWNIYHHATGYSIMILGIVNVFFGLDILQPDRKWKQAYIGVIVTLAIIAVVLEVLTWIVVMKRRSNKSVKQQSFDKNTTDENLSPGKKAKM